MKRSIVLAFALVLVVCQAKAQQEWARIPVNKIQTQIQSLTWGDSAVVMFERLSNENNIPYCAIIMPGGEVKILPPATNFPALDKVLAVSQSPDSLYFYHSEKHKGKLLFKALAYHKQSLMMKVCSRSVELPDGALTMYEQSGELYVLAMDKSSASLRIVQIRNLNVVRERAIMLPEVFFNTKGRIQVLKEGVEATAAQALAPVKFYVSANHLTLSVEQSKNQRHGVHLCTIDLTQNTLRANICFAERRPGENSSASYLHQDQLYRIAKDNVSSVKGLYVSIYDTTRKEMKVLVINNTVPYHDSTAYLRDSETNKIDNKHNVEQVVNNILADEFITVQPYDSSRVILKIGTHKVLSRHVILPIPAGAIPGAIVGAFFAAASALNGPVPADSRDRYFYLIGNPEIGFTYWKGQGVTGWDIDNYELHSQTNKMRFKVKGYSRSPEYTLAIYQDTKEKNVLRLVKFPKP